MRVFGKTVYFGEVGGGENSRENGHYKNEIDNDNKMETVVYTRGVQDDRKWKKG